MKIEILALAILLAITPIAHAKTSSPLEKLKKTDSKVYEMPAGLSLPGMQRSREVKGFLDKTFKAPTFKQQLAKALDCGAGVFVHLSKHSVHRGDPKTEYERKENRRHSERSNRKDRKEKRLDLSSEASSNVYTTDEGISANYYYENMDSAQPYEKVVVLYDANTLEPIHATGYTYTTLTEMPDVSEMTLTYTAVRADGMLGFERYESGPDSNGAMTEVSISYDRYFGTVVVSSITLAIAQPLNLDEIILPSLP